MSRKNGNRYTHEFKNEIVDLYHIRKPVEELSSEYGISTVTIYKWVQNLSPFKVSEDQIITNQDYKTLQKKIAQLQMENEILKKATAIAHRYAISLPQ